MAAIWNLPVLFVCENNLYASTTKSSYSLAGGSVAARACAYGIAGRSVDGNDVLEVREAVREAVEKARAGGGTKILENLTYRYRGHFEGDPQRYRTNDEIDSYRADRDPVFLFAKALKKKKLLSAAREKQIRGRVKGLIEDAVLSARAEAFPAPEEALEDLFVNR
jgi:pyruvate dehydrogenase E1 component alpha subunit